MILATARGLGRIFNNAPVFDDLQFELRAGERIGLVGPNGAGKTTLMRIVAGLDHADTGELYVRAGVRVGLLRQQPDFGPEQTLLDVAREGLGSVLDLQRQVEEAAQELSEAEDETDRIRAGRRYDELQARLDHQGGYTAEHRIEEILAGLNFTEADYDRPARTFSGGQQSRLMLAKLLLQAPELMLLDEPSNHLDIETTTWLEEFLSRQLVAMIVVSHDRYFLDRVVTKIWELHHGTITAYPGNYTQYWTLRQERAKVLQKQYEKQQEQIADLEAYIRKYGAGQRAKQAHDREKKLARIDRVETMRDIEGPVMGFGEVERAGDIVIEARNLSKSFDKPLFTNLNVAVHRGQCVGLLGPNGSGKSTLIKTLIGRQKPDGGEVKIGHKVQVGYYDQGLETLPPQTSLVRAVWPEDEPEWVEQDVRDLLAKFGLMGEMAFRTISQLSGGEKGKAALARLAATGANVLVMDEPTNHLDIWSCEALERSILEFEGTILVVSHDRYFLNQVADRLIVLGNGQAKVIEGDYETYQRLAQQQQTVARKSEANGASRVVDSAKSEKKKRKFPYRKSPEIEAEIAEVEAELAETEDLLGQPATWRDSVKARDLQLRYDDRKAYLARLYEHWEEAVEFNT